MKLSRFFLATLLLILAVRTGYSEGTRRTAPAGSVRIGIILGLTGDGAASGISLNNGLAFGFSDFSPELRSRLDVQVEDDQLTPAKSVAAFNQINLSGVDVLINASAPTSTALAPLADRAGAIFLSFSSDARLTRQNDRTFLFWPTPERVAERAVQECAAKGLEKIAVVTTQNEGRMRVRDQFVTSAGARVDVELKEEFLPDTRDFRSVLSRIASHKEIDAVMINLFFGQIGTFAHQARQLGIKGALFGADLMADPREIAAAQGALEGQWYIAGYEGSSEFKQRFLDRYPTSTTFGAAYGYDLAMIIKSFLEEGRPEQNLAAFITSRTAFSGELGEYKLLPDHRFDLPVETRTVPASE